MPTEGFYSYFIFYGKWVILKHVLRITYIITFYMFSPGTTWKKSFYADKSSEELLNVGYLNLFMFPILKPFIQSADEWVLKGTASRPDQRTPLHAHKITGESQHGHAVMEKVDSTPRQSYFHSSCLVAQQEYNSPVRHTANDAPPAPQQWINHSNFTRTNPYLHSSLWFLSFPVVVPQSVFLSVWCSTSSLFLGNKKNFVYTVVCSVHCVFSCLSQVAVVTLSIWKHIGRDPTALVFVRVKSSLCTLISSEFRKLVAIAVIVLLDQFQDVLLIRIIYTSKHINMRPTLVEVDYDDEIKKMWKLHLNPQEILHATSSGFSRSINQLQVI